MNMARVHRAIGPIQTSVSLQDAQTLLRLTRDDLHALIASSKLSLVPTRDGYRIERAALVSRLADFPAAEMAKVPLSDPLYVLIVDDDIVARVHYTHVAERAIPGCVVLTAANGDHAIALMKEVIPDVVITDLSMPSDGFRLAWWLYVSNQHAGVLTAAVTGLTHAEIDVAGGLPPTVKVIFKSEGPQPLMRWLQAVALVADCTGSSREPLA